LIEGCNDGIVSPMVEGIPAFFAASRYGVATIVVMAVLFAASTMATYLVRSVAAASGLQRLKLGAFEQYGEIIGGAGWPRVRLNVDPNGPSGSAGLPQSCLSSLQKPGRDFYLADWRILAYVCARDLINRSNGVLDRL
jgi:hypothetical protein